MSWFPSRRATPSRTTPAAASAPPTPAAVPDSSSITATAVAWARDVVHDPTVVYLDTETTGLGSDAEILEIAIIDQRGQILLDTLVRPRGVIPPDATRIHGIGHADVRHAPTWSALWPQVAAQLQGRRVIVYNAQFDYRMVQQENTRCGLPHPPDSWECAMRQYAHFAAVWHARYGNYRWHRLDDALARFTPQPSTPAHRARADAAACRIVVSGIAQSNGELR